ncbi:MAG: hypothetical protein AAGK04_02405 [Planctomycetota bacterium]
MAKHQNLSSHQQKIVKRYYQNLDSIAIGRLSEVVGELYLAESDKARGRLWDRAAKALDKVAANDARVQKILDARDVEGLAGLVNELAGKR